MVVKTFSVTEKRIVSYNPALAKKQKAEIQKMADKASNYTTYKTMTREELGDSAKYVKITSKDRNGKKIKPVIEIDKEKMDEDLKYAGYNLMVTSELDMDSLQFTKLTTAYGRSRNLSGLRSPIWMRARFTHTKKKQSMGIF